MLLKSLSESMPEGPPHYPPDHITDRPARTLAQELIREKVLLFTHEEVPYAVAVRVEELTERERPPCLYIRASIFVEQDSQRGILIGRGGAMLKRVGSVARRDLERFFGIKVFLALTVGVRRNWRKDERALREFGFLLTS